MTDMENPASESSDNLTLDIEDILRILPHRYPLLLVDRVTELTRTKRIVAIKNVTVNEPFFVGHFPDHPIMPGVLVVEAMAQAGGVLLLTEFPDREQKLLLFTGIERARFRRPVVPGDQLRIEVDVLAWRGTAGRMQGKALRRRQAGLRSRRHLPPAQPPGFATGRGDDSRGCVAFPMNIHPTAIVDPRDKDSRIVSALGRTASSGPAWKWARTANWSRTWCWTGPRAWAATTRSIPSPWWAWTRRT